MLSHIWLFGTPWTIAHQVPLSMEFPRQEYWNGLPFPTPIGNSLEGDYLLQHYYYFIWNFTGLAKFLLLLDQLLLGQPILCLQTIYNWFIPLFLKLTNFLLITSHVKSLFYRYFPPPIIFNHKISCVYHVYTVAPWRFTDLGGYRLQVNFFFFLWVISPHIENVWSIPTEFTTSLVTHLQFMILLKEDLLK